MSGTARYLKELDGSAFQLRQCDHLQLGKEVFKLRFRLNFRLESRVTFQNFKKALVLGYLLLDVAIF
jgi:hypothetical protein